MTLMLNVRWPRRPGKTGEAVTELEFAPSVEDGCGSGSFQGGMTEGDAKETGKGGDMPPKPFWVTVEVREPNVASPEHVENVTGWAGWRRMVKRFRRRRRRFGKRLVTHLDGEEAADLKARPGGRAWRARGTERGGCGLDTQHEVWRHRRGPGLEGRRGQREGKGPAPRVPKLSRALSAPLLEQGHGAQDRGLGIW